MQLPHISPLPPPPPPPPLPPPLPKLLPRRLTQHVWSCFFTSHRGGAVTGRRSGHGRGRSDSSLDAIATDVRGENCASSETVTWEQLHPLAVGRVINHPPPPARPPTRRPSSSTWPSISRTPPSRRCCRSLLTRCRRSSSPTARAVACVCPKHKKATVQSGAAIAVGRQL